MAGEIEYCLDRLPKDTDLAIVEGQGALNNMFYSGVTLGLLHGCMPDFLIMTHEPGRKIDAAGHSISNLKNLMDMHIDLLRPFKETKFLGINLLTLKLDRDHAMKTIENFMTEHSLPVTDIIRFNKNSPTILNSSYSDKITVKEFIEVNNYKNYEKSNFFFQIK